MRHVIQLQLPYAMASIAPLQVSDTLHGQTWAEAGSGRPAMRLQSPSAIASIAPSMRRNGSTESLVDAGFLPSMVAFCSGICDEIDWTMGLAALPVLHTQICRQALHDILHANTSDLHEQLLTVTSVRARSKPYPSAV